MTNKIKESNISDGAVTSDKIAPGTIANDRLAGSISNDKLAGSIANAKLANSSITINGTSIALGASGNIVAGTDWQAVVTADGSTATTASAGEGYFIDTTSNAHTINLPASPSQGDEVHIIDYAGKFGTNNVTVGRNSSNIDGAASDATLSTNRLSIRFVYIDSTQGWRAILDDVATVYAEEFISATGGTVSTVNTDYKVHVFNSSSTFVVSSGQGTKATVDYLVVAGGGGGGGNPAGGNPAGGGGGAGGYRESHSAPVSGSYTASPLATTTGIQLSPGTYPVTVGAGGSLGGNSSGGDSVFSTITSSGGGDGGANPGAGGTYVGQDGGSGGGAGGNGGPSCFAGGTGNTPPVSPSQGFPGGGTNGGGPGAQGDTMGGGGGSTEAGANANPPGTASGRGGAGTASAITGTSTSYAGGGGGGGRSCNGVCSGAASPCGTGGEGGGHPSAQPVTGDTNTGGGGGGTQSNGTTGGAGGSGVVVIRYKFQ